MTLMNEYVSLMTGTFLNDRTFKARSNLRTNRFRNLTSNTNLFLNRGGKFNYSTTICSHSCFFPFILLYCNIDIVINMTLQIIRDTYFLYQTNSFIIQV